MVTSINADTDDFSIIAKQQAAGNSTDTFSPHARVFESALSILVYVYLKTAEEILIAAYIRAWEDGNDVISASIGMAQGWADWAWDLVVSRIVAEGVPCLLGAGNGGLAGIFYATSAAGSRGATAIGSVVSVENTQMLSLLNEGNYTVDDATAEPYLFNPALANWTAVTLPLWAAVNNTGNTTDASLGCAAYPDSTPDLSGYLVLARAGICSVSDKG
ncbi:hypothetical protein OQA88_10619 [Cercophora sp. LCS_1]